MYTIGNAFGNRARATTATPSNPANRNERDERLAAAQASLKKKQILNTAENKKQTLDSAMKIDTPTPKDKEGQTDDEGNTTGDRSDEEMETSDQSSQHNGTNPPREEEYVVDNDLIDDFLKESTKAKVPNNEAKGTATRSPTPDRTATPPPPKNNETREPQRDPSPPRDPIITNPHLFLEPPSGGWPEVAITRRFLYKGTHVESFPHLENIPHPKFVAYIWGSKPKKEGSRDIKTIKEFIKNFMPEAKPKIFQPLCYELHRLRRLFSFLF
ncbi:hypothetical protein CVT24_009471, partial [Panaeolus cyanescens]